MSVPPGARPTAALRVAPAGDRAVLVQCADNAQALAVAEAARRRWAAELEDVVPGHDSVLLVWRDLRPGVGAVGDALARLEVGTGGSAPDASTDPGPVVIGVVYDGADLAAIARRLGLSVAAVIALHCAPEYRTAFLGFLPGFPYLLGCDPRLELPRLATPRTRVPAGSVALAAGYCGIYPRAVPGGWNLVGHTPTVLFDPARDPPTLLQAGMRVRFEPLRGSA